MVRVLVRVVLVLLVFLTGSSGMDQPSGSVVLVVARHRRRLRLRLTLWTVWRLLFCVVRALGNCTRFPSLLKKGMAVGCLLHPGFHRWLETLTPFGPRTIQVAHEMRAVTLTRTRDLVEEGTSSSATRRRFFSCTMRRYYAYDRIRRGQRTFLERRQAQARRISTRRRSGVCCARRMIASRSRATTRHTGTTERRGTFQGADSRSEATGSCTQHTHRLHTASSPFLSYPAVVHCGRCR